MANQPGLLKESRSLDQNLADGGAAGRHAGPGQAARLAALRQACEPAGADRAGAARSDRPRPPPVRLPRLLH